MSQPLRQTWRQLAAQPFYSAVTGLSLAIGLATVLVIGLWVADELNYDTFYPESDSVFRVITDGHLRDNAWVMPNGPAPLAEAFKSGSPAVVASARLSRSSVSVSLDQKPYLLRQAFFADADVCEVFGVHMLQGRCEDALEAPDNVLLSRSTAELLFGSVTLGSEPLLLNGRTSLKVAGIFEDWPQNAHMHPEAFFSSRLTGWANLTNWGQNPILTYIRLRSPDEKAAAEAFLDTLNQRHVIASIQSNSDLAAALAVGEISNRFYLQPVKEIHLDPVVPDAFHSKGSMMVIQIFAAAALLILLLAAVNFVSMTTATGAMRAKEIGIRKVLGSDRAQLVSRFLVESICLTLVAGGVAFLLAWVGLTWGGGVLNKPELASMLWHPAVWMGLVAACLLLAVAAGLYPALSMSAAPALSVMKGQLQGNFNVGKLRNVLLGAQIVVATVLLMGTWTISKQFRYMLDKDLGFDEENVLVVQNIGALQRQHPAFQTELRQIPGVTFTAAAGSMPGFRFDSMPFYDVEKGSTTMTSIEYMMVEPGFVATMGMSMVEGREFSAGVYTDSTAFLVNESAARLFGWQDGIEGKQLSYGGQDGPVIGVVKNFNNASLQHDIGPLVILHQRWVPGVVLVRVDQGMTREAITAIQAVWEKFQPAQPFQFTFLDQTIAARYQQERQLAFLMGFFSVLSMVIIGLGLISLMAHITLRKTREVSIRKVLGASFGQLVGVLAKRLVWQWAIASMIALPLGYALQSQWLARYSYRIPIDWTLLVLPVVVVGLVLALTVSYQIWKAAQMNPVKSLRTE